MKQFIVIALLFAAPQLMAASEDKKLMGELELEYCHIPHYSQEVLCGSFPVFEDRVSRKGREIEINFAVIPSITEAKEADPLVFFAGGPGQGARDMGRFISAAFSEVRENRDVILIDQRGMGSSHPLACEQPDDTDMFLSDEQANELMRDLLTQCLDALDADVTKYTQDLANQDIHDILVALGYDKVNLYGVSWGTRSALLYVNQFPKQVRTVIMDGVAPLSNRIPLYANQDAERAIQALFKDCDLDKICQTAFPKLKQDFDQVLTDFGKDGYEVSMNDANTGKPTTFRLTRKTFVSVIRNILYVPDYSRLIPIIIQQAKAKDFRALAGLGAAFGDGDIALGAMMSVLCSEDFSRISNDDIADQTANGFVGDAFIDVFRVGCAVWPKAPVPAIYNQSLISDVPTMILSGALDPVTPQRWGEKMKELMTNSLHLVAANTGHNVGPKGCAPDLMKQLITQGNLKNIDGSCLDEINRPTFFIDGNGPSSKFIEPNLIQAGNSDKQNLKKDKEETTND